MREQLAGDARVLAGHEIGALQHVERAQRDVAEVSDRRRHEIEARRQRPAGLPRLRLPGGTDSLAVA